MQDRMIEQKPIIARTNAPVQMPMYMPQGFGGSASIDQRSTDIMRGEVNNAQNKVTGFEKRVKELTEAQKAGYIEASRTKKLSAEAKKWVQDRRDEDPGFETFIERRPEFKSTIQNNL